jgi:hypothetical protein
MSPEYSGETEATELSSFQHSEPRAQNFAFLGFAQRTTALFGRPSLFHCRERSFLIWVIEPPALPKIG